MIVRRLIIGLGLLVLLVVPSAFAAPSVLSAMAQITGPDADGSSSGPSPPIR